MRWQASIGLHLDRRDNAWSPRQPVFTIEVAVAAAEDQEPPDSQEFARALNEINRVWDHLFPVKQARICRLLLDEVTVTTSGLDVRLQSCGVATLIAEITAKEEANNV